MKIRCSVFLLVIFTFQTGCERSNEYESTQVSIEKVREDYGINVCENTYIRTSNEVSYTLRPFWRGFTVTFPNEKCLEDFFDAMELRSELYVEFNSKKYFKVQGIIRSSGERYMINRIDKKIVGLMVEI